MTMLILFLLIANLVVWTRRWKKAETLKGKEATAATFADCDVDAALLDWLIHLPSSSVSLDKEGRKLIRCKLYTYDWFLRTHPSVDGSRHRAFLEGLLN